MGKPRRGGEVRWAGQCGLMCGVQLAPDTGTGRKLLDQHHSVQWLPRCAADTGGQEPVWDITSDRCQGGVTPLLESRLEVIAHHIDVVLLEV